MSMLSPRKAWRIASPVNGESDEQIGTTRPLRNDSPRYVTRRTAVLPLAMLLLLHPPSALASSAREGVVGGRTLWMHAWIRRSTFICPAWRVGYSYNARGWPARNEIHVNGNHFFPQPIRY